MLVALFMLEVIKYWSLGNEARIFAHTHARSEYVVMLVRAGADHLGALDTCCYFGLWSILSISGWSSPGFKVGWRVVENPCRESGS